MIVYGLSGKSGTGKSYNATALCGKLGVSAMIDDGLLIYQGSIVAGSSAKKQSTKIGAVRAALFDDEEKRSEMIKALAGIDPRAVLILGTSDKMVDMIAARLELPEPQEHIHIEDISSKRAMRKAEKLREQSGIHMIPAPTFQLRKQFSGYFLDPRKAFAKDKTVEEEKERTIVRPTYSYFGSFNISGQVITDIVEHLAEDIEGISDVLWVASDNSDEGMYIRVILQCDYGANVRRAALRMQSMVSREVAFMTAFNVLGVEVEVREFNMKK